MTVPQGEGLGDPFSFAQNLPQFPVRNPSGIAEFWTEGSTIARIDETWSVIVINSAKHHYTEDEARAGTFDAKAISALEKRLRCFEGEVQMAVLHHHPILHSSRLADSSDVLPTGDHLLDVLGSNGVKWVIHGHRHAGLPLRRGTPGQRSLRRTRPPASLPVPSRDARATCLAYARSRATRSGKGRSWDPERPGPGSGPIRRRRSCADFVSCVPSFDSSLDDGLHDLRV